MCVEHPRDPRVELIGRCVGDLLGDRRGNFTKSPPELTEQDFATPLLQSLLQAFHRQVGHYAYHVGQVVYLARSFSGARWKTLSVPVGGSDEYARAVAAGERPGGAGRPLRQGPTA